MRAEEFFNKHEKDHCICLESKIRHEPNNDTLKVPLRPHGTVAPVFLGVGVGRNGKLLFKGEKVLDREKRSIGLGRPVAK